MAKVKSTTGQEFSVEFVPMVLDKRLPSGEVVKQPLSQYSVMVGIDGGKPIERALVGTAENAPLMFLQHGLPEELKQAVKDAVAIDLTGNETRRYAEPPPPRVEDDEDE